MNWCVLLTMAIDCIKYADNDSHNHKEERELLYKNQLRLWLAETNLHIFIVESTGNSNTFDEFVKEYPERLIVIGFSAKELTNSYSSSELELLSLKEAMKVLNNENFDYILKVTGRYYLPHVEYSLKFATNDVDIYKQHHCNPKINWQNTEYYGIKKARNC